MARLGVHAEPRPPPAAAPVRGPSWGDDMATDKEYVQPVSYVLDEFASEVVRQIKQEDQDFLADFRTPISTSENDESSSFKKLSRYAQKRFRKQLKALNDELFPEGVMSFLQWANALIDENHQFMFEAADVPQQASKGLSRKERALRSRILRQRSSLRQIRERFIEDVEESWRKLMAGVNPRELTLDEVQELRDDCLFETLLPKADGMYAEWRLPKRSWHLKDGPPSTRDRFNGFAKHAAIAFLGDSAPSGREYWQQWLDLLMCTEAFYVDRQTWEGGKIPSLCEASAGYLEGLVLEAKRRQSAKGSGEHVSVAVSTGPSTSVQQHHEVKSQLEHFRTLGDWKLSPDGHTVITPSGPIPLNETEASIIEILWTSAEKGVWNLNKDYVFVSIEKEGLSNKTRLRDYFSNREKYSKLIRTEQPNMVRLNT